MNQKKLYTLISIALWLLIWLIAALLIDNKIFLPTPLSVLKALINIAGTKEFYFTLLTSLRGILLGFLIGFIGGIITAALSYACKFCEIFFGTFMKIIKSIPVASFIILTLFWVSSKNLSILISALIVLPIIYGSFLTALKGTDKKLLEFAKVYRLSCIKKVIHIYIPGSINALIGSCQVAIGYAWKSGVAAEIIGLIRGTIGNELYKTKLYLASDQLFAWTITIILLSFICEKIIVFLLNMLKPDRFKSKKKGMRDEA